jgi:7-cyano-7-deazaguanine synthase
MTEPNALPLVPRHAVVIVSGGLDSTVLAYWLRKQGAGLTVLSVDYGQRHRVELDYARRAAERLGVGHHVADLTGIGRLLTGSALTDPTVAVPDGHYAEESMRATIVPNRNALMLDVAVGLAIAVGADAVAYGAHAGDHPIYPDCRPSFVKAYRRTVLTANEGSLPGGFDVIAPFVTMTKADIVGIGARIGVPFEATWSCYRGRTMHCGTCGTCVERAEAFAVAGVADPTLYAQSGAAEVW